MQQLFLGISPKNLAGVPFAPVLTQTEISRAGDVIALWGDAALLRWIPLSFSLRLCYTDKTTTGEGTPW